MMLKIEFLGGHPAIEVEDRPAIRVVPPEGSNMQPYYTTDLHVGWGDRESDLKIREQTPRQIKMLPPKVYRHKIDEWTYVPVSDAEVARVQALVDKLWMETSVAPACESYRQILQGIHECYLPKPRPAARQVQATWVVDQGKRAYIVEGAGWDAVTDIPCPVCLVGIVQWHEAGYVPGYRQCDKCRRQFLATTQALGERAPKDGCSLLVLQSR